MWHIGFADLQSLFPHLVECKHIKIYLLKFVFMCLLEMLGPAKSS